MLILLFTYLIQCATEWSRIEISGSPYQTLIVDAIFRNCNSESNGGAICLRSVSGFLDMDTVEFYDCTASSAGAAIFLETGNTGFYIDATKVCVSRCSTNQNCQYGYFRIPRDSLFHHTYTTIFNIQGGAGIFESKDVKETFINNWNVSQFGTSNRYAISIEGDLNMTYLNMDRLRSPYGMELKGDSFLSNCNFVDNEMTQGTFLDVYGTKAIFSWSFFSNCIGMKMHFTQSLYFYDCYLEEFQIDGNRDNLYMTRCSTNTKVIPTNMALFAIGECEVSYYSGTMVFITDAPKTTPFTTPLDTPYKTPFTTPLETPYTTPIETPYETPFTTPLTTPYETPFTTPFESPYITPFITPFDTPYETPFNTPIKTPSTTTSSSPSQTLEKTPNQTPLNTISQTQTPQPEMTNPYKTPFLTPDSSEIEEAVISSETHENSDDSLLWFIVGIIIMVVVLILCALLAVCITRKKKGKILKSKRKIEAMDNEEESFYEDYYDDYEEESRKEKEDEEEEHSEQELSAESTSDSVYFPLYGNGKADANEVFKGEHQHDDNTFELDDESFSDDEHLIKDLEDISKNRPQRYLF